jgi:hypothetical protein
VDSVVADSGEIVGVLVGDVSLSIAIDSCNFGKLGKISILSCNESVFSAVSADVASWALFASSKSRLEFSSCRNYVFSQTTCHYYVTLQTLDAPPYDVRY